MAYPHNADWSLIPEHTRGGLQRYLDHGIPPGSFLLAVLSNDLHEAYGRADHINSAAMQSIVTFLHSFAPNAAWGSPEKVRAWLEAGGTSKVRAA